MKKKIFAGVVVLAIAVLVVSNVNLNMNQKNDVSLLELANVEALAAPVKFEEAEAEALGSSVSWYCWSSLKSGGGAWLCGSPCVYKDKSGSNSGRSQCFAN